MYNLNRLIQPDLLEQLLTLLPRPRQKKIGRKRCDQKSLVLGIIYVLKRNVPWYDCPDFGASASSCFRYFKEIQRRGSLKKIFKLLVLEKTDIKIASIDSSSITSFRFKSGTGFDGKHKKCATKVSALADSYGLPADIVFGKGNIHDLKFVPSHIKNISGRAKKVLNLDKGYTSLQLRRDMRQKGIFVNMEIKSGDYIRKIGPKFKLNQDIYNTRFTIERLFGWLKSFKRCRLRQEFTMSSFKAFIYLSLIIILIKG
jgi:transposase